jgi:hypothetical protein
MLIGYMRVSSESDRQTTDLQRAALLALTVGTYLKITPPAPRTIDRGSDAVPDTISLRIRSLVAVTSETPRTADTRRARARRSGYLNHRTAQQSLQIFRRHATSVS